MARLHAYTPGLQPTEPGWVKLNTNECPYAPSPQVTEALHRDIGEDGAALRLYPNPKSDPLRTLIANVHGLPRESVIVGNGSDDLLNLIVRAFCAPITEPCRAGSPDPAGSSGFPAAAGAGDPALPMSSEAPLGFMVPSYSLYPVLVEIQNGRTAAVDFDRSMQLPVERIAASAARAFILTSPNAPTGVGFTNAEFEQILRRFRGLLVIDEAYAPFAQENAVPLVARHSNVMVVRTLSKAFALAGIRVGYALAHPEVVAVLDRVRDSYNVSRLSQTAAIAALGDPAYYAMVVAKIKATRDASIRDFEQRGWFTYRSQANFIFTEPRNARGESGPAVAQAAYAYLYAHKVLVRYFPSHALTASFLRISVGTDDEMLVLHDTLDAWQKS